MPKAYKIYGHRKQRIALRKQRLQWEQDAIEEQWVAYEEFLASGEGRCNGVIYVASEDEIPAALETFFKYLTEQSQKQQSLDTQGSLDNGI